MTDADLAIALAFLWTLAFPYIYHSAGVRRALGEE
jgi:hypothetical protein